MPEVECPRCQERNFDEGTTGILVLFMLVGFFVGYLAVGAFGFVSGDFHLELVGGVFMGWGFGLLAWALRLRLKRKGEFP